MGTFFKLLHVLAAVLVMGTLALAPLMGLRALMGQDLGRLRDAAKQTWLFGLGSLLVAALGGLTLTQTDGYTSKTPWVIISMTLFVVDLLVVFFWARPALGKAIRLAEAGAFDGVTPWVREMDSESETPSELMTATTSDVEAKAKLDSAAGRIGAAGGVNLLLIVLIVVMMVVKPFGT
ncbi:DUF2269 family protein [Longispora albida]|uniref:DUF2269 family protein n=1 Tax=Longispora albida TaxID=203523 RepID=UPI0003754496|nr:DUF2269 family protein [Longispora albida]